mmetsp:Transcript_10727/g.35550  ORF Transcript_10727/g.35550 Transcript_10727/m.35550 type:complete len:317 (-) Transcript_10727:1038-1988(-)
MSLGRLVFGRSLGFFQVGSMTSRVVYLPCLTTPEFESMSFQSALGVPPSQKGEIKNDGKAPAQAKVHSPGANSHCSPRARISFSFLRVTEVCWTDVRRLRRRRRASERATQRVHRPKKQQHFFFARTTTPSQRHRVVREAVEAEVGDEGVEEKDRVDQRVVARVVEGRMLRREGALLLRQEVHQQWHEEPRRQIPVPCVGHELRKGEPLAGPARALSWESFVCHEVRELGQCGLLDDEDALAPVPRGVPVRDDVGNVVGDEVTVDDVEQVTREPEFQEGVHIPGVLPVDASHGGAEVHEDGVEDGVGEVPEEDVDY